MKNNIPYSVDDNSDKKSNKVHGGRLLHSAKDERNIGILGLNTALDTFYRAQRRRQSLFPQGIAR